jgi:3-hydroxyacyl-[acyl-carrier-protein] dehydratase
MTNSDAKVINISQIMDMIPHRYPLLLVDRIIDINENKNIVGIKNITFNEPQFMGHFPKHPVMPGVLIVESLAQVSAVLVAKSLNAKPDSKLVYFMSIDSAKFRKIVSPGDTMILKSEIIQSKHNVWKFSATAEVDGILACECEFKAMVKDKE